MISKRVNRAKEIRQRRVLWILGVFIVVFLLGITGVVGIFSGFSIAVAKPFLAVGRAVRVGGENISLAFKTKKQLTREVASLKQLIIDTEADVLLSSVVAKENETLKTTLGRMESPHEYVFARVLMKPNQSPYDTLILDVGERDGVRLGDQVFAQGVVHIGKVFEVDARTSKALLYSAPGEKTLARLPASGIDVELIGRGGGAFSVALSRDVLVAVDEAVVIPDLYSTLIGRVVRSVTDPRDPSQTVYVKSPINIQTLDFVEVRKSNE